ncbi:MAG TPA: lectin-like protein [Polyangiaceae bacterium]|nr:lectin-like protein [Polyangiaceae bacterium]
MVTIRVRRLGSLRLVTLASAVVCACSGHPDFFDAPPVKPHFGGAGSSVAGQGGAASGGRGGVANTGGGTSADAGRGGASMAVAGAPGSAAGQTNTAGTAAGGGSVASAGLAGAPASVAGSGGTTGEAAGEGGMSTASGGTSAAGGLTGTGGQPCVPSPEVCDGLDNDCNGAVDEGGACPDGCTAQTRDGHVYLLCLLNDPSAQLDYDAATMACASAGTTLGLGVTLELARLESADENDFAKAWIVSQATTDGMVWFGANDIDQEGRWVWGRGADAVQFFTQSDGGGGTPYMGRFNDFAAGEPNDSNGADEDCGSLDSEYAWQWNDLVCMKPRLGFLCEQE